MHIEDVEYEITGRMIGQTVGSRNGEAVKVRVSFVFSQDCDRCGSELTEDAVTHMEISMPYSMRGDGQGMTGKTLCSQCHEKVSVVKSL